MCSMLCMCPGAMATARIRPSAGLCPKRGHSHPAGLWRTTTHSGDPSHLPAPPQVLCACGSAEHFPIQLPEFGDTMKPNKPLSNWVWPGQSGFQGASDSWGPRYETHCWRAGHDPWGALGPSPSADPKGTRLPAAPEEARRATALWDRPAACHDTFKHQHNVLCMFVCSLCTRLALEETKMNHSQTWRQKKGSTGNCSYFCFVQCVLLRTYYILAKQQVGFFGSGFFFDGDGGGVIFMKNP